MFSCHAFALQLYEVQSVKLCVFKNLAEVWHGILSLLEVVTQGASVDTSTALLHYYELVRRDSVTE